MSVAEWAAGDSTARQTGGSLSMQSVSLCLEGKIVEPIGDDPGGPRVAAPRHTAANVFGGPGAHFFLSTVAAKNRLWSYGDHNSRNEDYLLQQIFRRGE